MKERIMCWGWLGLSLALVALAGCGGPVEPSAAPTPVPSLVPTQVPSPTSTSVPPNTPTPTPVPLVQLAEMEGTVGPVYSVAWSPDGRVIASAGYRQVRLWDADTYAELATMEGHTSYVWGVAWSPDGRTLASASQDGTVRLWDAETFEEVAVLDAGEAWCVAWSPDGTRLAVGLLTFDPVIIRVFDAATGELLTEMENPDTYGLISIGWSPDGEVIAAGQFDGALALWDPDSGAQLLDEMVGTQARSDVNGLAWSPDGQQVAVAQQDGVVRLWSRDGELVRELRRQSGWLRGIAWSPDGRLLASAGQGATVRLWDAETGVPLALAPAGELALWGVAWSPDGSRIAVGSGTYNARNVGGTVTVWSVPLASSALEPAATPDVPAEEVTFATEDGATIAATLFGREGDIAVLLLHQGAGSATQNSWHSFARRAAERGFVALTPDFRNRGHSEGPVTNDYWILDARAAIEFLRSRGFSRFVCMGAGVWGATPCVRLALDGELEGLVVIAGSYVSADQPITDDDLAQLTVPKLFVYGERDREGVPEAVMAMYDASGEPRQVVTYDSAARGTDLFLSPYGEDLTLQLLTFLEELRGN